MTIQEAGEPLDSSTLNLQAQGWRLLLGFAASIVAVVAVGRLLDFTELQTALRAMPEQPQIVGAIGLTYTAAFLCRSLAWRLLLSTRLDWGRLFSILQVSLFLNHLLPLKAGEVARPYLATRHGVPASEAASTTIVARLADFVALALIASLVLPRAAFTGERGLAFGAVVGFIAIACLALVVLRRRVPALLPARAVLLLSKLQIALRQIDLRRIALAAPLILASWLLEGFVLFGAARLLGVELSFQTAAGATAFTILFQVVHVTPGGLGVYETSMTSVLVLQGVPAEEALTLAVVTHGLKFAYSFAVGLPFAAFEVVSLVKGRGDAPKRASRFEIVSARLWNVINEGKPFTVVFTLAMLLLLSLPHAVEPAYWLRFWASLLAIGPLFLLFFRFDFPLKLRGGLWVYLLAFVALFGYVDFAAIALVLACYLTFTVFMWGTVYYHLRIGTPWTNFLRFWRLVLENPDPTSGNFQEQLPKVLILVFASQYLVGNLTWGAAGGIEAFAVGVGVTALLLHQWLFTWVPALPQPLSPAMSLGRARTSKRFIAIVIDGCRADRLREADTPFLNGLRAGGTDFTNISTVYPARTVTGFSSMFTGAPPKLHGMRSNFVPSLGVKCDSVFAALERNRQKGRLVGIAHLIDAFGEDYVKSVTAVMHNDEIDDALVARARRCMDEEDPDLLVLQLLSVDQTGHARGSYNDEYLRKIEATDQKIEQFLAWCETRGYLEGATVLITADHGQGIGIGGHGHMTPPEIKVPCILWGAGVEAGQSRDEMRFVTDIASTICHALGAPEPAESVGMTLLAPASKPEEQPVVFVVPAYNEAAALPGLLASVQHAGIANTRVVVVDDGSTDATSAVAAAHGAVVVRHERNRGLGAALRSGLQQARELDARAAVYLDGDGEYGPAEAQRLLAPIEAGTADYVLGSRFKGRIEGMTLSRRIANHAFSVALSVVCGRWVSDGQTGYRAFSRRALDVAEIVHDYNYAQVLTMDLLHKGMRMAQVPASYRRRRSGRSFVDTAYLWRVPLGMVREMLGD